MITHVRNAFVSLVLLLSIPLAAQTLPPPPATVAEAVKSCNDLAYGFPKNTVAYWEGLPYASDPLYFYKRMCGWQSEGGVDQALFGLYAVPPSAWRVVAVPVPVPPPAPLPLPSTDLTPALIRLEAIELRMSTLEAQQRADTEAIRGDVKSFRDAANATLKVVAKYAGPAIAALFAGRAMK